MNFKAKGKDHKPDCEWLGTEVTLFSLCGVLEIGPGSPGFGPSCSCFFPEPLSGTTFGSCSDLF